MKKNKPLELTRVEPKLLKPSDVAKDRGVTPKAVLWQIQRQMVPGAFLAYVTPTGRKVWRIIRSVYEASQAK